MNQSVNPSWFPEHSFKEYMLTSHSAPADVDRDPACNKRQPLFWKLLQEYNLHIQIEHINFQLSVFSQTEHEV